MATFNVFVEGPVDDSPMGLPELADAMSQRYGLSAKELVTRLKRGRFRVKSNLDAEAAERYRKDLISIGARVIIEDSALSPTATPVAGVPITGRAPALSLPPIIAEQAAAMPPSDEPRTFTIRGPQHPREPASSSTAPPTRPTPSPTARPTPPSRPSAPPSGLSAAGPRASTPPPVRASTPIPADMISGLSAAYGEASPAADLGALGALSLASLDGESAPEASNQFDAPPPEDKPAITITAKPKSETPRARPAPSKAMDLFAPPDAGDQELRVDLATEEIDERARKQASLPPPIATSTPATTRSQSMPIATTPAKSEAEGGTAGYAKPFSREHFAIGVVLALVVGFIPAHFVARSREKTAFAVIDKQVEDAYSSADSIETYQVLDTAREKFIDEKQSKRSMIGLTSMLLWAVISTAVGFAYFRFLKR